MEVTRRAFLGSAVVPAVIRRPLAVACALDESRIGFAGLPRFHGHGRGLIESSVGLTRQELPWLAGSGIMMSGPVPVRGPAWIRFHWPVSALIRDFGRICHVSGGDPIAYHEGIPVAARSGNLIVLGTPLGPSLYAADRDARRLLRAFLAT